MPNPNLSLWTEQRKRIALAIVLSVSGSASTAAYANQFDLFEVYQQALISDSELNSARAQLESVRHTVPQAKAGVLPNVSANAQWTRNWSRTNVAPNSSYTNRGYGISLAYPLFRLQNITVYDQAKLRFTQAEAQFANAQQDLILRVARAYFDALAAANDLNTVKSQKTAIEEQFAAAKRNFEVGTATVTDQQEAQARFDLTVAQELASQNTLAVRLSALSVLTNRPITKLADLRGGVTLSPPKPRIEQNWTDRARENNFGVSQARIGTEVARREIDRQKYARYPTVDVVGSIGQNYNPSSALVGVRSRNSSLGLQLGVPIYTGGLVSARVRQAVSDADRANADLEGAQRAAEQASRQAYLGLISGLGQVRALEAAEKSSRLALDSNRLGYRVGVRINVDVLNAQQQLFSTQRDLARARYDVLVNGLALKSTVGALTEKDLRDVSALLTFEVKKPETTAAPPAQPTKRTQKKRSRSKKKK
jgi:outer membrane protein